MEIPEIKITAEITPPPLTTELAVRVFEELSKSRNARPEMFGECEKDKIYEAEDQLYRLLLERLKHDAVILRIATSHGTT